MSKKLALFILIAALVLGACSAAGVAPMSEETVAQPPAPADGFAGGASVAPGRFAASPPMVDGDLAAKESANMNQPITGDQLERLVIKNANLSLIVKDPMDSVASITALAESLEGFVVSSNTYQASTDAEGNKIMQASITVRVPSAKLDEVLAQLRNMAVSVSNENISGEDVTAQYTDLESQLRNLEAAEAQLQKIMDSATKTEDVLNVYNQLTSIRGQIEMVKGQMKYYRESAALSAVTVNLIPDALSQPIEVGGWKPQGEAKAALEALVRALQGIASALIWGAIYLLPLVLIFGLPAYFGVRWMWRKLRNA